MVDAGKVPGVTNESLWEKRQRNKTRKSLCRQRKRAVDPGRGISDRPAEVEGRREAGRWDIELVVSGQGEGAAALLTLTERKTQKAVVRAINGIERQMGSKHFEPSSKALRRITVANFLTTKPLNGRCSADRLPISTMPIPIHPG